MKNYSCSVQEYNGLFALYNATNGPQWDWSGVAEYSIWNFGNNSQPCGGNGPNSNYAWYGVSCDCEQIVWPNTITCSVVALNLISMNLDGRLPTDIVGLAELRALNLRNNSLSGSIPEEIGLLTGMQNMFLTTNYFTGMLPTGLGMWSNLFVLSLSSNYFTGHVPSCLGNCLAPQNVDLASNLLSGKIPQEIGFCKNLTTLSASSNVLTGRLPRTLFELSLLSSIYLEANSLSGDVPSAIGVLTNLYYLDLASNRFSGEIPQEIGSLKNMVFAFLSDNHFSSTIPSEIGAWGSIEMLYLDNNDLSHTIPSQLFSSTALSLSVHLQANQLSGCLPSQIFLSNGLYELVVDDNALSGALPDVPQTLTRSSLLNLQVGNNCFTSTVPSSWGALKSLALLGLGFNSLTGTLPATFGNLTAVETLSCEMNSLSGSIPRWDSMRNILNLVLGPNSLTGSIDAVTALTSLQSLVLTGNSLTGSLPTGINSLINLEYLNVLSNELTGPLPCLNSSLVLSTLNIAANMFSGTLSNASCLPSQLLVLNIADNMLEGTLPSSVCLVNLTELILTKNKFTGELPSALMGMSSIKALLIGFNRFEGRPDAVFDPAVQTLLSAVDISANAFTGSIPEKVFELPILKTFAAVESCYIGSLPDVICSSSSLQVLLLDGLASGPRCRKKFNIIPGSNSYLPNDAAPIGTIPACLWAIPSLNVLHLSSNLLVGSISPSISPSLNNVVLSHNQLSGTIPMALQRLSFQTLDLSFNRLKGMLEDFVAFNNSNVSINLINNRLSGFVPAAYSSSQVASVNVLRGNLFDCDAMRPLPSRDPLALSAVCGSANFDLSALGAGVLIALALALATAALVTFRPACVCCYLPCWLDTTSKSAGELPDGVDVAPAETSRECESGDGGCESIGDTLLFNIVCDLPKTIAVAASGTFQGHTEGSQPKGLKTLHALLQVQAQVRGCPREGLTEFVLLCRQFLCAVALTLLLALTVSLPLYIGLKADEVLSTHTFQYLWTGTSAFLSGGASAAAVSIVWTAAVFVVICFIEFSYSGRIVNKGLDIPLAEQTNLIHDISIRDILTRIGAVLLFFFLVGCANIGYLYFILFTNPSTTAQTGVQVILGLFKSLVNTFVVPLFSSMLCRSSASHAQSGARPTPASSVWQATSFFVLYAINNLIAPFLVSIFAESNCLFNMMIPEILVEEEFRYQLATHTICPDFNINVTIGKDSNLQPQHQHQQTQQCYTFSTPTSYINEFYPPFTYGYQCGSAIIQNYVPVFTYSLSMHCFLGIVSFCFLHSLFLRCDSMSTAENGEEECMAGNRCSAPLKLLAAHLGAHVSGIWRPLTTRKAEAELLPQPKVVANVMQMLLMLLTMGLSSPLFAAIAVTATSVEVLLCVASIDRYVRLSPRCYLSARLPAHISSTRDASVHLRREGGGEGDSGRIPPLEDFNSWDRSGGLDAACLGASAAAGALCAPVIYISALYWALMVFDMVGNTTVLDPTVALWAPAIVITVPLCFQVFTAGFRLLSDAKAPAAQESEFAPRARRTGVNASGGLKAPLLSVDDGRTSYKGLEMTGRL